MYGSAVSSLEIARVVFGSLSDRLWKSFEYLLRIFDKKDSRLFYLLNEYRGCEKLPALFFAAHEILVNYYVRGVPDKTDLCKRMLDLSSCVHYKNLEIVPFFTGNGLQDEICLSAIYSDIKSAYGGRIEVEGGFPAMHNDFNDFQKSRLLMCRALKIINSADENLYKEIDFVVDEVRIFNKGSLRAGTNFNMLGVIYIGCCSPCDDVSRYIEHVVHEAAHTLLYAHWTQDPLFKNHTKNLYLTPFRRDSRPLSAIYHAAFVLARTIYVFDKIYKSNSCALDFSRVRTNYNERGNDEPFKDKFLQTLDVIYRNAMLTEYGRSLIESCQKIVDECQVEI